MTVTKLVAELLKRGATAGGWRAEKDEGYRDAYGELWRPGQQGTERGQWALRFERTEGDVKAVVVLNVRKPYDKWAAKKAFSGQTVEGHTICNGGTFTRVGFDCDSCSLVDDKKERYSPHDYADLTALLAGEWDRCVAYVAKKRTAVPVPGLPFTRQPEWFVETGKTLKAGQSVRLSPHGMGTGYVLYAAGKRTPRHARRAAAELETLLNAGPVFVETYDHD